MTTGTAFAKVQARLSSLIRCSSCGGAMHGYRKARQRGCRRPELVCHKVSGWPIAAGREVAEAVGTDKAVFQRLDVTDKSSADATVAATLERFGRLDILVNNAGIVNRAPFLEYGLDAWRTVLSVNLTGAFICGQTSARAMANAGRGRIINIASVSGQFGGTGRAAYGASKAGIISLTQTMAMELGMYGITVNAVAPGCIDTPQLRADAQRAGMTYEEDLAFEGPLHLLNRFGTAEEVANAILFLASDEASFITGTCLMVDGGYTAK